MDDPMLSLSLFAPLAGVGAAALVGWLGLKQLSAVFSRSMQLFSHCRLTGTALAKKLLETAEVEDVSVADHPLRNHYDWRRKRLVMRTDIAASSSLLAVAVAAHEVGHAEQFARGYWGARLTPVVWIATIAAAVGVVVSIPASAFAHKPILSTGEIIAAFAGVIACQAVVYLSLERDANRRARENVRRAGLLADREWQGFEEVLHAGFFTYGCFALQQFLVVAAVAVGLAQIPNLVAPPPIAPVGPPREAPPMAIDLLGDGLFQSMLPLVIASFFVVWIARQVTRSQTRTSVSAVSLSNEGLVEFEKGRLEAAIGLFNQALAVDPALAATYFNRAVALTSLGRANEALADMTALFATKSGAEVLLSQPDPWVLRGSLRSACDNPDGAIEDMTRAIELGGEAATIWRDRGLARLHKQDYAGALADFDEAVRRDPSDGIAHNNCGAALAKLGRYSHAAAAFERSMSLTPELPNPYRHLAWMQATCPDSSMHNAPAAVRNATRAVQLTKEADPACMEVLAAAFARAGDFASATQWEERRLAMTKVDDGRLELYRRGEAFTAERPWV